MPAAVTHLRRALAWRARTAGLTLALTLAPVAAHAQPFTSLTFFGDSYGDTGNAFALTGGLQAADPPYALRRFSNGLVFTDYLAEALGRPNDARAVFTGPVVPPVFPPLPPSGNFAIGGARTDGNLQSTSVQIEAYLARAGVTPGTRTDPTGLYSIFVGGNDLRDISGLADPVTRQAFAAIAAANVLGQAQRLVGAGARNVLLFTLQSPSVLPEAIATPGLAGARDEITRTFNATLAAGVASLQQTAPPGTVFYNFRLDNLFQNILIDAGQGGVRYGLTNVTTPCLPGFPMPPGVPGRSPCGASVFADYIHPTTRTHELIGTSVARYLTTGQNVAVIPEPATVALVGVGLAGLAGAARRRRAA